LFETLNIGGAIMAEQGFKRKLTAILSADVVGYSRLMEDNEEATIKTLNLFRDLLSDLIQQHRGRLVDMTGDNLMAEFSSVVDAVKCAVEMQKEMSERNADLPYKQRMLFRIGINLGDIVEEDERIYGDGVNIAARLEGLAEAGGICISRTTYDQVKKKLELGYEYLGEHNVKNIAEPVHAYKILMEPEAVGKIIGEKRKEKRRMTLAVVIVLLLTAGGFTGWYLYIEQAKRIEPASIEAMKLPLPEKPSIAVLPFDNMSGDPEQDYIADGFTENIITGLSQIPEMFVIARNSVFTYKGKPVKVNQVSEELGVNYVLEGSIQKAGDQIRVNAQLIDAIKGRHLWAEKYDRGLKDILEIQDEITLEIVTALQVKLTEGEQARLWGKELQDINVYLKSAKALSLFNEGSKESMIRYGQLAQEIVDMAPELPVGYRKLGWYNYHLAEIGKSPRESMKKAYDMAQKALSLNESDASAYILLAYIYKSKKEYDKAIESGMRAVELAPNGALIHTILGSVLNYACRFDEALVHLKQAIRLDPFPAYYYYLSLGLCYSFKGQYKEALTEFKKTLQRAPNYRAVHLNLAITYAILGREGEARASAAKALELIPNITVTRVAKKWPYKCEEPLQPILDAMRKAGFPE